MLKLKFTLLITLVWVLSASATILYVDNNPTAPEGRYATLQEAHGAASNGDTLYVLGPSNSYGDLTLTQTLYIYGAGYFLDENPDLQVFSDPARTGRIIFDAGSEGSLIAGLYNGTISGSNAFIQNNILVSGNFSCSSGDCTVYNNICNEEQFPEGNGNQRNVDMSTVFVGYPGQGQGC